VPVFQFSSGKSYAEESFGHQLSSSLLDFFIINQLFSNCRVMCLTLPGTTGLTKQVPEKSYSNHSLVFFKFILMVR